MRPKCLMPHWPSALGSQPVLISQNLARCFCLRIWWLPGTGRDVESPLTVSFKLLAEVVVTGSPTQQQSAEEWYSSDTETTLLA